MVSYSTNWMGPINLKWIQENGDNWMAGRIDMRGDSLGPYGDEVGVPPIDKRDWQRLTDWLDTYETEEPDYNVLETFQKETGRTVTFWRKET